MAVPTAPHCRIAINQSLGQGEVMVTTVKMGRGSTAPTGSIGATAEEIATATIASINTWLTSLSGTRIVGWTGTGVDYYLVGSNGLAYQQASRGVTAPAGNLSAAALPLETAMVLTLLTGGPGARRRGRTYMGGFSTAVMSAVATERGKFIATQALAQANHFKTLLQGLTTACASLTGGALVPVVVSNASTPPSGYTITSIRVGDVPDVQRRRTDSQVESFQSVAV